MRIAMWSGPRNLSTALMYSFAQRPDCTVWDEPFYAAYLQKTGLDHPMRTDILAQWQTDPDAVVARCIGSVTGQKRVFYQKHMTQHMLPDIPRDWMAEVTNVFLIRHPARVIASYAEKRENPTLDDIGFRQQFEIYDHVRALGQESLVVDSFDIRTNPVETLSRLCTALRLTFDPCMLTWPKGGNAADGPWAAHWYNAVWNSTTFAGPEGALPEIPDAMRPVLEAALPFYEALKEKAF